MNIETILLALKGMIGDFVKNEAKQETLAWLQEKVLPATKELGDAYITALKESSDEEHGWCRFRDYVFLPLLVNVVLFVFEKSLDNMVAKA